jgi:hypothetical protein
MLSRVRIVSGPAKDAPKAKNAAEIQGQGTIPYAMRRSVGVALQTLSSWLVFLWFRLMSWFK